MKKYSLSDVMKIYDLNFEEYGIVLIHPDTTDLKGYTSDVDDVFELLKRTRKNFYLLYPNFDDGYEYFYEKIKEFNIEELKHIQLVKNMRFEAFKCLLRYSKLNIGNSSSFVRESPDYGKHSLIVGKRQVGRVNKINVIYTQFQKKSLSELVSNYWDSGDLKSETDNDIFELKSLYESALEKIFKCSLH